MNKDSALLTSECQYEITRCFVGSVRWYSLAMRMNLPAWFCCLEKVQLKIFCSPEKTSWLLGENFIETCLSGKPIQNNIQLFIRPYLGNSTT